MFANAEQMRSWAIVVLASLAGAAQGGSLSEMSEWERNWDAKPKLGRGSLEFGPANLKGKGGFDWGRRFEVETFRGGAVSGLERAAPWGERAYPLKPDAVGAQSSGLAGRRASLGGAAPGFEKSYSVKGAATVRMEEAAGFGETIEKKTYQGRHWVKDELFRVRTQKELSIEETQAMINGGAAGSGGPRLVDPDPGAFPGSPSNREGEAPDASWPKR